MENSIQKMEWLIIREKFHFEWNSNWKVAFLHPSLLNCEKFHIGNKYNHISRKIPINWEIKVKSGFFYTPAYFDIFNIKK